MISINSRRYHVQLFFSFKDSISDIEKQRYVELMELISWFFFDLLMLGYVEDQETGLSFRIPGEMKWNIYIEVKYLKYKTQCVVILVYYFNSRYPHIVEIMV